MTSTASDLQTFIVMLIVVGGIGLVVAGATRKVVIYYDLWDLGTALAAAIMPMVVLAMWFSHPFESSSFNMVFHWVITPMIGLLALVPISNTFRDAITHNRSWLIGIPIGLFKMIFAWFAFLSFFKLVDKTTDRNARRGDMAMLAIIFVVTAVIAKLLVNGPEVYASRGWSLPERTSEN